MVETLITYGFAALVTSISVFFYLRSVRQRDQRAREAAEKGQLYSDGPKAQHPKIDTEKCIGCQSCTMVCPEGDVLAMLGGKAVIVNGHKCIGHSLCAEACPVGAITMAMASPSMSANMPFLTPEYETSVGNLFVIGELGGLALIKNAVNQGRECIDTIHERRAASGSNSSGVYDVIIVGAGPAGLSASLRAVEHKLRYLTLEQDEIGGTVAKYPRQKLVMTSPVEFPLFGKFNKTELTKENLLAFWNTVLERAKLEIRTGTKVLAIQQLSEEGFSVVAGNDQHSQVYRAQAVVLALGRAGTPRKLGVQGEHLPKVMYRLIEADHYVNKKILVVGGGDSAVEAAIGLSRQAGNQVTLSYRKDTFSRIKERNTKRIEECVRNGKVEVIFNSAPAEIRPDTVVLDVNGEMREIENDFVWVFAGGIPPYDFLKKIGVAFGTQDVTLEAANEARQAVLSA